MRFAVALLLVSVAALAAGDARDFERGFPLIEVGGRPRAVRREERRPELRAHGQRESPAPKRRDVVGGS